MPEPIFLTIDQVIAAHADQIATFGGDPAALTSEGRALLESALAQPEASWGGQWLNSFPFEMAAAYLYSICEDHPFQDGNKRVALDTALAFLALNGFEFVGDPDATTQFVLSVASGKQTKGTVCAWLEANSGQLG
jgi:death on curing protein